MVKNAVSEMRRYYSRKVVDVLIRVTRRTLDLIIKQFAADSEHAAGDDADGGSLLCLPT